MGEQGITPEVRAFIHHTINSVEQLEVLLFLMSNPERDWSSAEVSERVRLTPDAVETRMAELRSARLLAISAQDPHRYKYAPDSDALANEVAQSLDQAYRERKDTVIQLIFSRPLNNIKVFADAFKIKRGD